MIDVHQHLLADIVAVPAAMCTVLVTVVCHETVCHLHIAGQGPKLNMDALVTHTNCCWCSDSG